MAVANAQSTNDDNLDGAAEGANRRTHLRLTADDVLVMLDEIVGHGVDVSNHSYSYNDGQYAGVIGGRERLYLTGHTRIYAMLHRSRK